MLFRSDATLRLINKILSDDLSTRQVADIVKGRANAQESVKPAGRQRYAQRLEIKLGGVSVGDLKSYGDDRLELREEIQGHTGGAHGLAVLPGGKQALSGGADRAVLLNRFFRS